MPAVKETKIAYAKLCEKYFTSIDTTSDHCVDLVNTSRVEINTSRVELYTVNITWKFNKLFSY